MDEIDVALEFAKQKKMNRLRMNNVRRLCAREKPYRRITLNNSSNIDPFILENLNSMHLNPLEQNNSIKSTPGLHSAEMVFSEITFVPDESMGARLSSDEDDECNSFIHRDESKKQLSKLHPYTSIDKFSFCKDLIKFIRKANLSKTHAEELTRLFNNSFPQPHGLPNTYYGLLDFLSGSIVFFYSTQLQSGIQSLSA
jgi:hypothetical protein